jgi:AraC-like DNA-binding protein
VPTYVLAGLVDVARERKLRFEPWFAGTGIAPQQTFEANARVSYRQASQVIRRALRSSPRGDLGLAVGSRESLVSFGVLGFAMLSCRTLADALQIGLEHHQISGSLMDPSFELARGDIVLQARERFPDQEILPFLCEELFGSTLMLLRSLVDPDFRPRWLELSYAVPPHAEAYRQLFRCPIRFGVDANRVAIEARWLEHRLPTYNPLTLEHALRICREQTAAMRSVDDVAMSVAQWLRERMRQRPGVAAAARALNLSERTLRRRLAAQGLSFRDVMDRVRAEMAEALLHDERERTVAEIGSELGFSDGREFRRAFRRWTGKTPQQVRGRRA